MIELLSNVASFVIGLGLLLIGISLIATLYQIFTANRSKVEGVAKKAGGLRDFWMGSMPVRNHGDRRFECTAGLTINRRTGEVTESARISDEIVEEAFNR